MGGHSPEEVSLVAGLSEHDAKNSIIERGRIVKYLFIFKDCLKQDQR
jgi:hypothetical protein